MKGTSSKQGEKQNEKKKKKLSTPEATKTKQNNNNKNYSGHRNPKMRKEQKQGLKSSFKAM